MRPYCVPAIGGERFRHPPQVSSDGGSRAIVDKLAAEAKCIWNLPEVKKALLDVGADSALRETSDAFAAFTRAARAKWAAVVDDAVVKIK